MVIIIENEHYSQGAGQLVIMENLCSVNFKDSLW